MINVELTGVPAFRANAISAVRGLRSRALEATKGVAVETLSWLRDQIATGALQLAPLSAEWAARKAPGAPILVDTSAYVDSMMVERGDNGYTIGVPDAMQQRALHLEYGTKTSRARPHWRPALDHAQVNIAPRVGMGVLADFAKDLGE